MKREKFWLTSKLIRIKTYLLVIFSTYVLTLPTSEELQPLTKHFETFLSVSLVSFHLK